MSAESIWRCDVCGETISAAPVVLDSEGDPVGPLPPGVDVLVVGQLPCPICGQPMRRVVGQFDLRSWEEQFTEVRA